MSHSMKHMYSIKIGQMGVKPLLLVDGHGSRFEIPFLRYISDEAHEWTVVTRVPYGTTLWQVGDSPKHTGVFDMVSVLIVKRE